MAQVKLEGEALQIVKEMSELVEAQQHEFARMQTVLGLQLKPKYEQLAALFNIAVVDLHIDSTYLKECGAAFLILPEGPRNETLN